MFLSFASPHKKVFLELVIELVKVFFVDLERGEGKLTAIYKGALKFVVCKIVESEPSLLQSFLHQIFYADKIA
jgi:hypothetical protein